MNVVPYYIVDRQTGAIVSAGTIGEHLVSYLPAEGYQEVRFGIVDPFKQYVEPNSGAIIDRTVLDPTVTIDGTSVTISPVPRPCTLFVDDTDYGSDASGELTINFGGAGTYKVTIRAASILDWVQEITVT